MLKTHALKILVKEHGHAIGTNSLPIHLKIMDKPEQIFSEHFIDRVKNILKLEL